jgi:hypothetical protein
MVPTPIDPEFGLADLEARLYQHLNIPVPFWAPHAPGSAADAPPDDVGKAVRRLKHELFELQQEAGRIGKIPLHYPRHIVLVMKAISALLPWYTRPIVDFSQRTSRTADALASLVDELLRQQELLAWQLAELRNTASPPVTGCGSGNHDGISPSASA